MTTSSALRTSWLKRLLAFTGPGWLMSIFVSSVCWWFGTPKWHVCWLIPSGNLLHSYLNWPFILEFTHWKWWCSIVMLVYQRVIYLIVDIDNWLVVWNMNFIFHFICGIIIFHDWLIFFKMVKTTNQIRYVGLRSCKMLQVESETHRTMHIFTINHRIHQTWTEPTWLTKITGVGCYWKTIRCFDICGWVKTCHCTCYYHMWVNKHS